MRCDFPIDRILPVITTETLSLEIPDGGLLLVRYVVVENGIDMGGKLVLDRANGEYVAGELEACCEYDYAGTEVQRGPDHLRIYQSGSDQRSIVNILCRRDAALPHGGLSGLMLTVPAARQLAKFLRGAVPAAGPVVAPETRRPAPGYMTEDLELRIIAGPPRYASRTEKPVEYFALETAAGERIGYFYFNDADDAAGFRPQAGASPTALNHAAFWVQMLLDSKIRGLKPSGALAEMLAVNISLSRVVPGSRAVAESLGRLEEIAGLGRSASAAEAQPVRRPRPVDREGSGRIEQCETCAGLEQAVMLDYERGGVRPEELEWLSVVSKVREDDGPYRYVETGTLVCESCGTFYSTLRVKDEGQSFMDPTEDYEAIKRLTVYGALEQLGQLEGAQAKEERAALLERARAVIDALAALLAEGGTAAWALRKHAVACVTEERLLRGDKARIVRELWGHRDPVIRAESALQVLQYAAYSPEGQPRAVLAGTLHKAALEFVAEFSPVPALRVVLAEAARPTMELDSHGTSFQNGDTHRTAARALQMTAAAGIAVDAETIGRLGDLLWEEGGGKRFEAAWALIFLLDRWPGYAGLLAERFATFPAGILGAPVVDMLVAKVGRIQRGATE